MTRPLVIVLLIAAAASQARAADPPRAPLSGSMLARAEKLLAELDQLDAGVFATDARRRAAIAAHVYAGAQALPDGDLKIDLATAARFYERASAHGLAPRGGTPGADDDAPCGRERPGAYRHLCAAMSGREMVTLLLLAKGHLHADWARASVADAEGATTAAGVAESVAEMRAERMLDAVLARQALVALEGLERLTDAPSTLAEFEAAGKVGRVSPAEFSRMLDDAARIVRQSLAWLPESPVKREIDNAYESYADGLWWWQRGDRPLVVKVSGNNFDAADFAAMSHVPAPQLGYNAVVNLRHARDYARRAETLLDAELRRAGLAAKN
ncbi:MAG: hypothetical protein ACJ741_01135 [Pyrinomonadaceae bacterium]